MRHYTIKIKKKQLYLQLINVNSTFTEFISLQYTYK